MGKEKRKDIFGITPELGDLIAFNPAKYKGLVVGECVDYTSVGLPVLMLTDTKYSGYYNSDTKGTITPKTGFIVHKINK